MSCALTRRIQGLHKWALRTLTRHQDQKIVYHQRLTYDTGVDVFLAHPNSSRERGIQ